MPAILHPAMPSALSQNFFFQKRRRIGTCCDPDFYEASNLETRELAAPQATVNRAISQNAKLLLGNKNRVTFINIQDSKNRDS